MGEGAVAKGKESARRRGALIVFQDEAGFSLLPSVPSTWAPRGKTPVLRHHFSWKRLSKAVALAYEPDGTDAQLVFQMRPGAHNDERLVEFLTEMHALSEGRLVTLIWDGLPSHRSRRRKEWPSTRRRWLVVEQLPGLRPRSQPHREGVGELEGQRARQPLPRHHRRGCRSGRREPLPDRRRDRTLPRLPPSHWSQVVTKNPRGIKRSSLGFGDAHSTGCEEVVASHVERHAVSRTSPSCRQGVTRATAERNDPSPTKYPVVVTRRPTRIIAERANPSASPRRPSLIPSKTPRERVETMYVRSVDSAASAPVRRVTAAFDIPSA